MLINFTPCGLCRRVLHGDLLYCKEQQGNISAEREKDVFYIVEVTSIVDIMLPPSCIVRTFYDRSHNADYNSKQKRRTAL